MPDLWMDVDTALTEVPVNIMPLIDDTDFKSIEEAIAYNQAGMDLNWNFVTTAGVQTHTNVVPTTAGNYDWAHAGNGMYVIEMTASGGASANNDTEGFGWFTGFCTGVLPWRGPIIGFRAAALNNALIDGGDSLDVNVTEISGDSTAANNLELDYDGTGYAKANSTIGTTTTNTDMVSEPPSTAQINAEVADVINTDAQAELASVPAANASLSAKVNWLFALARNKLLQTATTQTLRNDADSADIASSTISDDDTTFTRGEFS